MRRVLLIGCLSLVLASMSTSALAWEFKLRGDTSLRYRYITRTGNVDIFGTMGNGPNQVYLGVNHLHNYPTPSTSNRFNSAGRGVCAGENAWGVEANVVDYRAVLYPKIKINKALSLSGSVILTSLGVHAGGRPYDNYGTAGNVNSEWAIIGPRMAGANVPNTQVSLGWWKMSLKLPFASISAGMKTSGLGMGLWKHNGQRASTSFSVKVPYGPLTFTTSPYFARSQSDWNDFPRNIQRQHNPWRKDNIRNYFGGIQAGLTYKSGNLIFQLVSDSHRMESHSGNYTNYLNALTGTRPHPDQLVYDVHTSVKYNNSRVFVNAEANHFWQYRSGLWVQDGTNGYIDQDEDQSAWLYGAEIGTLVGPAKLTVNYFRATGDDPSTRKTTEDCSQGDAGASSQYVKDWAYLMYWMYGAGTSWDAAGEGQPSNMHHLGARIDYAVAANLNVGIVGAYAWRDQPNAFQLAGDWLSEARRFSNDSIWNGGAGPAADVAAVPDSAREIGWEIDVSVDWKLLENLTWSNTLCYWKPGPFWAYAYPNTGWIYGSSGGGVPAANFAQATVQLGRDIDPLIAYQMVLGMDF